MGKTAVEKIMARAAKKSEVKIGEIVWVEPDLITLPEVSALNQINILEGLGLRKPYDPSKVLIVVDHRVLVNDSRDAEINKKVREKANHPEYCNFFDIGSHGLVHQLPVEKGFIRPGNMVVSLDTHVTTLGAFGALAIPLNAEVFFPLAIGKVWMKVPENIKIIVSGDKPHGVEARDLILYLLKYIGFEKGNYRAIEFQGTVIDAMSIDERMTVCNGVVQMGAKAAFMAPDEKILSYLTGIINQPLAPVYSDNDAPYEAIYEVDISRLVPQVAAPSSPSNVGPVQNYIGTKIDWAYIASCASARMYDLRLAAVLLKNRHIHKRVKMLISPASQDIYKAAAQEGLLEIFVESGVVVSPPSCGPCFGAMIHLADGEVCIGTGTSNDPGRMGSRKADIYLASVSTVVSSALAGEIADPRSI